MVGSNLMPFLKKRDSVYPGKENADQQAEARGARAAPLGDDRPSGREGTPAAERPAHFIASVDTRR